MSSLLEELDWERYIGTESAPHTGEPVSARDIRRYALAVDDENPIFYDEAAAKAYAEQGLVSEEVYVNPREALAELSRDIPGAADALALVPHDPAEPVTRDELVPLHVYRPVQDDPRARVVGLQVHEPFVVYMKAAFVLGAVLASPLVFYYIWQFVAAGLYPHEKHYVHIFLPFSLGLFLGGVCIAFFFVFEPVLRFLFTFNKMLNIDPDPRISEWLSFVLILPLGFGIAFQLPLVMFFLERIGLFSVEMYQGRWRIAVLVICVLAMFLTPADPYSMMLLAAPLIILYIGGIIMCKVLPRRVGRFLDPE